MYHSMIAKPPKSSLLGGVLLSAALLWPAWSRAAELVMYERAGCVWCARWDRDIAPVYHKTPEAKLLPLRRVNLDKPADGDVKLASPVRYTPTFVVVDQGREIGRITGYISHESFWGLLGALVAKLDPQPSANPGT